MVRLETELFDSLMNLLNKKNKKTQLTEKELNDIEKYRDDNGFINLVDVDDFDEMKLFLKDPDAYVKAMDELLEKEQQQETEDEIMEERTSEEDYEAQKRDYNPDFDNFNPDDCDSSFFETD